ncbi:MAG: 4-hydroxy-3-methylbut-2-enyl diphosphate reductase [Syntrophaceae bacterium]|nr:4-hydroxy-3-methylbut-2-enyl diphosphate reductase [Syntrophaceae bacterium]
MSVRLAKTAGFCMGVKRAVDMVLDMPVPQGKVHFYTYGPLIHNPQTVELLEKRGFQPIRTIEEIQEPREGATLILRAHGISPEERRRIKESGLKIVDATCPKVGHVQAIIKKHASRDYDILLIGDPHHPEVNGLLGFAGERGIVVQSEEEVASLPDLRKVCVVAQTTQSLDTFHRIVRRVQDRFPETLVFDTICNSTEERQREIQTMAAEVDAFFIVGGRNSANTLRLAALASQTGTPTFHIETADELAGIDLARYDRIGVSAGASTPNWIIDRVVESLRKEQDRRKGLLRSLFQGWILLVKTDVFSSLGAGILTLACLLLQGRPPELLPVWTAALYVYAMHTLNRVLDTRTSSILGTFREASYRRHRRLYGQLGFASMVLALVGALLAGTSSFLFLLTLSVFGMLYNVRIWPNRWRFETFRDIPGSKNVSMATAWAAVTAILPTLRDGLSLEPGWIVSFLFVFALVVVRSALSDLQDLQSDRLLGRETIPVVIGQEMTQKLLNSFSFLLILLLVAAAAAGWVTPFAWLLVSCPFYLWICFRLCDRRSGLSGVVLEGLLETGYFIAGLAALLWLGIGRSV